jgi:hypothetical protein
MKDGSIYKDIRDELVEVRCAEESVCEPEEMYVDVSFWPVAADIAAQANVCVQGVRSTGQCNTACSLSAGVWKPKVFRGR